MYAFLCVQAHGVCICVWICAASQVYACGVCACVCAHACTVLIVGVVRLCALLCDNWCMHTCVGPVRACALYMGTCSLDVGVLEVHVHVHMHLHVHVHVHAMCAQVAVGSFSTVTLGEASCKGLASCWLPASNTIRTECD